MKIFDIGGKDTVFFKDEDGGTQGLNRDDLLRLLRDDRVRRDTELACDYAKDDLADVQELYLRLAQADRDVWVTVLELLRDYQHPERQKLSMTYMPGTDRVRLEDYDGRVIEMGRAEFERANGDPYRSVGEWWREQIKSAKSADISPSLHYLDEKDWVVITHGTDRVEMSADQFEFLARWAPHLRTSLWTAYETEKLEANWQPIDHLCGQCDD